MLLIEPPLNDSDEDNIFMPEDDPEGSTGSLQ